MLSGSQYKIVDAILYGSYARGDYDEESDIDIAILAKGSGEELRKYRSAMLNESVRYLWDYEKLVSLHEIPIDRFIEYKEDLPYYRIIDNEGIRLVG